jgi:hypothetical protein
MMDCRVVVSTVSPAGYDGLDHSPRTSKPALASPRVKGLTDGQHPGYHRRSQVLPDRSREALARPDSLSPLLVRVGHLRTGVMRPSRIANASTAANFSGGLMTSETVFVGHHQLLRTRIDCLDFMGLNLSSLQITKELDMDRNDVQAMFQHLRQGIVDRRPSVALDVQVECDEVYVVAGHKGNSEAVKKRSTRATPSPEGKA